jgi:pimeloyl-ACP methyl ester carboxylesterase
MKKILFFLLKSIGVLLASLLLIYVVGPRPDVPMFLKLVYMPPASLDALEAELNASEASVQGIKPGCAAKIVWADSVKQRTPVVLLYLHGFGASHEEGAPLPVDLARQFKCNLFLARLDKHGLETGESNLCGLTADSYVQSAEKALSLARQLGDSVVIMGTSGGGALGLFLCSRHPYVKGLITWSPAVRLYAPETGLLTGPWGSQLARLVTGKTHNDWTYKVPEQKKYWTNHQCFDGVIQFATFLKYGLTPDTFKAVKCPFFMGYYYENEENQDKLVSVTAMKDMFAQLSTPAALKRERAFPKAKDHVIGSQLLSKDWQSVEQESAAFMTDILKMK